MVKPIVVKRGSHERIWTYGPDFEAIVAADEDVVSIDFRQKGTLYSISLSKAEAKLLARFVTEMRELI